MAEFKKFPCSVTPDFECPMTCMANPLHNKVAAKDMTEGALEELDARTHKKNDIQDPEVQKHLFNILSQGVKILQGMKLGPPEIVYLYCELRSRGKVN